eukprot:329795-Pyramimonas_sp.AAC.1
MAEDETRNALRQDLVRVSAKHAFVGIVKVYSPSPKKAEEYPENQPEGGGGIGSVPVAIAA